MQELFLGGKTVSLLAQGFVEGFHCTPFTHTVTPLPTPFSHTPFYPTPILQDIRQQINRTEVKRLTLLRDFVPA